MRKQLLFIGVFLFIWQVSFAQKKRLVEVNEDDFTFEAAWADPSAAALILFDKGIIDFGLSPEEGFFYTLERRQRIRIEHKDGYEWADVQIPLYSEGRAEEKLLEFSASTCNLVDGKIVRTAFDDGDGYSESATDHLEVRSFPLPDVKDGSIIEISYKIKSNFIAQLRDWYFQYEIPAVVSELETRIPYLMTYSMELMDFHPVEQVGHRWERRHFIGSGYNFSCGIAINTWRSEKVPAFKEEPYMGVPEDYVAQMQMALSMTDFPGEGKRYQNSDEEVTALLAEDQNFGRFLAGGDYVGELLAGIVAPGDQPMEKVEKIYNFVKNSVKWNGERAKFTSRGSVKAILDRKTGNTADINLTTVCLLKNAGLEAYPMLLSTRTNGLCSVHSILLLNFNSVIAAVRADTSGRYLLLDATDPGHVPGMIEIENLNHLGLVIDIDAIDTRWINIEPLISSVSNTNYLLTMDDAFTFTGNIYHSTTGYTGFLSRKEFGEFETLKAYSEDYASKKAGLHIDSIMVKNEENPAESFNEALDVLIDGVAITSGDRVYFNPMFFAQAKENPFTLEERKFPVDFPFPWEKNYRLILNFPPDLVVESVPKGEVFTLPEGSGAFSYRVYHEGNQLKIESRLQIGKSIFLPTEYAGLRELFKHRMTKHAEMIVLRKKQ